MTIFRATGAHDVVLVPSDLFNVSLQGDDIQDFDKRWDQALIKASEILPQDVLEDLYKPSNAKPPMIEDYGQKRHVDQMIRTRNFRARNGRIGTGVSVKSQKKERMSAWTVSATEAIVDNKHSRPLLLQRRRHRLTERKPTDGIGLQARKSQWKERSESVQKLPGRK